MAPILVYGFPAGSSMGLVAAFEWLAQPYTLCRVDMLGEMREASYGRINFRHETPVLITPEGRPLTETMAIAAWLEVRDTEHRINFNGASPEADRMHQMIGFLNSGFTAAFSPLWMAYELTPPDPDYQAALRRLGRSCVMHRHDQLERMISDAPFLCGERSSLADAVFIGVARWLGFHDVAPRERWPKVDGLRRRLEADPFVQFAAANEAGETDLASAACKGHIALAEVIDRYGA